MKIKRVVNILGDNNHDLHQQACVDLCNALAKGVVKELFTLVIKTLLDQINAFPLEVNRGLFLGLATLGIDEKLRELMVKGLLKGLTHANNDIRKNGCRTLGKVIPIMRGHPLHGLMIKALQTLLYDACKPVRTAAMAALPPNMKSADYIKEIIAFNKAKETPAIRSKP